MTATLIDGRAQAQQLCARIAERTTELRQPLHRPAATMPGENDSTSQEPLIPGLALILVGDDPASQIYVGSKTRQAQAAGIRHFDHHLPASATTAELVELVQALNARRDVHGILVQLPLPAAIDGAAVLATIDPAKDVDGFHALNVGRLSLGEAALVPCTALGCLALIRRITPNLAGKRALVIGRSNIVGKPVAQLLLRHDCTVTIAHSRSRDLPQLCAEAEILVAAIGRPKAILGAWIRPGAIVIDVGINRIDAGHDQQRLVGDVDYDSAIERAGAITPVPGGVGPMTIACLLLNTLNAALRARSGDAAEVLAP